MKNSRERIKERQEEAIERAEAREKRGDAGQLKRLEKRGHGNCKEAKRLRKELSKN